MNLREQPPTPLTLTKGASALVMCIALPACAQTLSPEAARLQVVPEEQVEECLYLSDFSGLSIKGGDIDPDAGRRAADMEARERAADAGSTHIIGPVKVTRFKGFVRYHGYDCSPQGIAKKREASLPPGQAQPPGQALPPPQACAPEPSTPVEPPRFVTARQPGHVAGFAFGLDHRASQGLCEGAGHTWSQGEDAFICSGPPVAEQLPAAVHLRYYGTRLCDITLMLSLPPGDEADAALKEEFGMLETDFGRPQVLQEQSKDGCQGTPAACLREGKGIWQAAWYWETGGQLIAKVVQGKGALTLAQRHRFERF